MTLYAVLLSVPEGSSSKIGLSRNPDARGSWPCFLKCSTTPRIWFGRARKKKGSARDDDRPFLSSRTLHYYLTPRKNKKQQVFWKTDPTIVTATATFSWNGNQVSGKGHSPCRDAYFFLKEEVTARDRDSPNPQWFLLGPMEHVRRDKHSADCFGFPQEPEGVVHHANVHLARSLQLDKHNTLRPLEHRLFVRQNDDVPRTSFRSLQQQTEMCVDSHRPVRKQLHLLWSERWENCMFSSYLALQLLINAKPAAVPGKRQASLHACCKVAGK